MSNSVLDPRFPVCIVGGGARTAVGLNAPSSAAAIRCGISGMGDHPFMVDKIGEPMSVAMDSRVQPELMGVERFMQIAQPALKEALNSVPQERISRIPLILGLPEPRPGCPINLGEEMKWQFDKLEELFWRFSSITFLPKGHSGGLMALQKASEMIIRGDTDFCIAGGVDTYMNADTLEWLDSEGQLQSAVNRSGFTPGEGAGFCLLASSRVLKKLKLKPLGQLSPIVTTREENTIKSETVCIGKGLSDAISLVCEDLRLPEEKIHFCYCDMNGERYRAEEFAFAVLRIQTAFVNTLDNLTPADCWGDVGAASGPLFVVLAIASGLRGYARGSRNLLWTSSEGGWRSAGIVHLPMRGDT